MSPYKDPLTVISSAAVRGFYNILKFFLAVNDIDRFYAPYPYDMKVSDA